MRSVLFHVGWPCFYGLHETGARHWIFLIVRNARKRRRNTKTDLKELNEELDRIHNQGYAVIDEELQMGIIGAACPVFDRNGELAAAIAFTSMKDGDTEKMFQRICQLKECAKEISEAIR